MWGGAPLPRVMGTAAWLAASSPETSTGKLSVLSLWGRSRCWQPLPFEEAMASSLSRVRCPLGAGSLPAVPSPTKHLAVQRTHRLFYLQPGAMECQGAGSHAISLIPLVGPLCGRGGCEGAEWAFDRAGTAVAF